MDAVATAKLALDASGFDRGLTAAQSSVRKFSKEIGGMIAGAFAFDKIIQGFSSAIEKGDQLQDLANRFGLAASGLQEIGNAASLSGSGIDDVAKSMNKLAINAGKAIGGDTGMVKAFENIGLSVQDLKSMSPEDLFFALSRSIQNTQDPLVAFAKAQDVAGKSVTSLLETLRMGPDEIAKLGNAMGVWSNEEIQSLADASDSLKIFQNTFTKIFGQLASYINPVILSFQQFSEEITMVGFAIKEAFSGNAKGAAEILKSASLSHVASLQPKAREAKPAPSISIDEQDSTKIVADEKRKLDKSLYDEEIYGIQEEARLKENREKTIFDRMVRDAEFARDEKKRVLELEKETAMRNRELVMRGMEASGTILDRARASAERLGMGGLVRQIDIQRQQQQRQTDVSLISGLGATPGERRSFRDNEKINALTQTEGDLMRQQNTDLLNSFDTMQKIVSNILNKIDDKLGVPILKSAY